MIKNKQLIVFRLLFILLFVTNLIYAQKIVLSNEEKDFLRKHPTIILGSDENWKPHIIKKEDNTIIGYDSDILEKINKYTGANFQLHIGKWNNIVEKAKNKEIDGLSTSAYHKERAKFFNFSNPYITSYKILLTSKTNPKQIESVKDLEGKRVAIHKGNLFIEKITEKIKDIELIKLSNFNELIDKLIKNEVDAIIEGDVFLYSSDKSKLLYTQIVDFFEKDKLELVFSIRKDWPEALSILNKGLNAISEEEKNRIRDSWFFSNSLNLKKIKNHNTSIFSKEELNYLSNLKKINMCIDPNWMPFEKIENGKHVGISADYFKLIKEIINTPIEIIKTKTWLESLELGKKRSCDIFSLVMPTPERKKYLDFTKPYLTTPLVLVTKTDELFITDITKVIDKKIGIVKGYAYGEILKTKYPHLKLIDVDNITDGLEKVQQDQLFGFIGALATVGYNIQRNYTGQLKITGKFDEEWSLGIGTRNDEPILLSIFNKAIDTIKKEEHQRILNKWLAVKYEKVSYEYLFEIIILFLIILVSILFINRKLSHEIKKRKEVEEYLNIIIKGANLGTWTWYPKTNENIINDTWANIIGYTKKEVDKVNNLFEFIYKEDLHQIKKALKAHEEGEKEMYESIFRMKAKDNSTKWIYSCGSIVKRDEKGNPILYAGIHQDITPKKELEEEIKKQNEFIYQQSKQAAMGEMLENIAHQWRQPLSLITTSASSVQFKKEFDSLSDEDLNEAMKQIMKSGKYLSETIEDFRGFFKKDKRYIEFGTEEVLEKSLQFLKAKMKTKEIFIIKDIKNTKIISYENELIQALMNIFNNSIDALENIKNKRLIFITVTDYNDSIIIKIKDNAKGIKENILDKIFDPYFTTKHQSQGTGIGLHMTRVIIEQHLHGSIKASNTSFNYENTSYKGAIFTITLPKKKKDN